MFFGLKVLLLLVYGFVGGLGGMLRGVFFSEGGIVLMDLFGGGGGVFFCFFSFFFCVGM